MDASMQDCAQTIAGICRSLIDPNAGLEGGRSWLQSAVPFSQAFGPLLSLVAIAVGWFYVSRDNDKREGRKELRELLNHIRTQVLKLEELAHDYFHKGPAETRALAMDIKREMQRLADLLMTLKGRDPKFKFDSQLATFRSVVTGSDFDSAAREIRQCTDRLFLEITSASLGLTSELERIFCESYARVKF